MFKQTFDQLPETIWVTAVQVATVWTAPASPREIDRPALTNAVDMENWLSSLTTTEKLAWSEDNLIQTQLLYGDVVQVIETHGDWAKVVIPAQASKKDERGYPGWVPITQLRQTTKTVWMKEKAITVTAKNAWMQDEQSQQKIKLSFMTTLPLLAVSKGKAFVGTPQGKGSLLETDITVHTRTTGLEPTGSGQDILAAGKQFMQLPYFWGGMSSFGYDCSGFAHMMHKSAGYIIARDASDQAGSGKEITYQKALPGDLLFFCP
ncbi:NlpC/P60 family protein [Virgibacillus halophilus]|uniref:NlpC/P60 family protein n=1 Tax=Tigheibacillus halophilus TaxID=361280 RepID=A0ABU5C4I1_9BACI|nr:NlpC/P60 family protein [Virgibacillus halophilus]